MVSSDDCRPRGPGIKSHKERKLKQELKLEKEELLEEMEMLEMGKALMERETLQMVQKTNQIVAWYDATFSLKVKANSIRKNDNKFGFKVFCFRKPQILSRKLLIVSKKALILWKYYQKRWIISNFYFEQSIRIFEIKCINIFTEDRTNITVNDRSILKTA